MQSAEKPAFQRAFVAVSYLLGQRGPSLLGALTRPNPEALELVTLLDHADRTRRAQVLAAELSRVALELDQRCFR